MKFNNVDLAMELDRMADIAADTKQIEPDAVRAFAQYIADHPTVDSLHPTALDLLNIRDIPSETWGQPAPARPQGELRVAASVQRLNEEYVISSLHAIVALRRLAWDATQLARELQRERADTVEQLLASNERRTTGLFAKGPTHLSPAAKDQYKVLLGARSNNG